MTHEEAFIQAIREAPNDDAPRLIFADWLEERGQADRAEFIRVQCRLFQLQTADPESSVLRLRAEDLLRRHWEEWVGPLRDIVGPWRDRYGEGWLREEYHFGGLLHFPRGFVSVLGLDTEDLLQHAERLKRLVPLRELRLWRAGRCADRLASEPLLAGLSVLSFLDYYDAPLMAGDARSLAKSPYLHGLSTLYLERNSLGDDGVEALARAPWLADVSVLDLSDNGLSDRALHALADSPYVANLRALFVRRNYLSSAGIDALRSSPNLRFLTQLEPGSVSEHDPVSSRNLFLLGSIERP